MISPATGVCLAQKICRGEGLVPAKCGRPIGWEKLGAHTSVLLELVGQDPDITMTELRDALLDARGVLVHHTSLSRALQRLGYRYKKSLVASQCRRADIARARHDWIRGRQPRMRDQPDQLVFIDETAVKTNLTRLRGRAPRGQRLKGEAPFGR